MSAGVMLSAGLALGVKARSSLWGAEVGGLRIAGRGPVERRTGFTSVTTIALDLDIEMKFRVVTKEYLRLRPGGVRQNRLHPGQKG
jgi:hypothetical protein